MCVLHGQADEPAVLAPMLLGYVAHNTVLSEPGLYHLQDGPAIATSRVV